MPPVGGSRRARWKMWRRCSTRKLEHLAPRHAREDSCVGDVCGADVIEVHAYVVMTVTCQTATILMKMTVIEVYGLGDYD